MPRLSRSDASWPSFSHLPPLAPGGLTCMAVTIGDDPEGWHAAALGAVTASERLRATRFRHRRDATLHLVGRALVRTLMARETGAGAIEDEFSCNAWGKPALADCDWEFSISHSGCVVWVAFCREAPVGVDCEQAGTGELHSLLPYLHPGEQEALLALPAETRPAALLRCWTRKEAVIKAVGEGLSRPLASFRVRADGLAADWLAEAPDSSAAGWTVQDLPDVACHRASVAAMAAGLSVTCHVLER